MTVQTDTTYTNIPFIEGSVLGDAEATLLTDGSRTTPLADKTLMGKIAATGKWVPFTDEAAITGAAVTLGIYSGDAITAAALVAGDVLDAQIITHGMLARFDKAQLVIENSKLLTTVVTAAALTFSAGTGDSTATLAVTEVKTVGDILKLQGLHPETYENIFE